MKKVKDSEHVLISQIEDYLAHYVSFANADVKLPLALWTLGTYCFPEFDAFPYLVITSATKRSGKTRLAELLSFCCSNPRNFAAMTGAVLFRSIESESPTILFDEAETLSSEAASTLRAVLNVGYRKGQTIPRSSGDGIKEFQTYCPKVFILIGDVYDTLRDRSIVVQMVRADAPTRFVYEPARQRGADLRELASAAIERHRDRIAETFSTYPSLEFLMDRDEEIWTPLFVLCSIFAHDRIPELSRIAVDLATEKTAEARKYTALHEDEALDDQYALKLLHDLYAVLLTSGKVIGSSEAVEALQAIPTAPWRKFRGKGIRVHDLGNMLSRFGVKPVRIAIGSGRGNQKFLRGYKREHLEAAITKEGKR